MPKDELWHIILQLGNLREKMERKNEKKREGDKGREERRDRGREEERERMTL